MTEYRSHGTGRLLYRKIQQERERERDKQYIICMLINISFSIMAEQAIETHPTVMSKMLLPTQLDTAMSARPLRATITLVIKSGMDVSAARVVII